MQQTAYRGRNIFGSRFDPGQEPTRPVCRVDCQHLAREVRACNSTSAGACGVASVVAAAGACDVAAAGSVLALRAGAPAFATHTHVAPTSSAMYIGLHHPSGETRDRSTARAEHTDTGLALTTGYVSHTHTTRPPMPMRHGSRYTERHTPYCFICTARLTWEPRMRW